MRYNRIEKTTTKHIPPPPRRSHIPPHKLRLVPRLVLCRLAHASRFQSPPPTLLLVKHILPASHRSLVYRAPPRIHPLIAYPPLRYMNNTDRATHRPAPMPSSLLPRGHHQHSNITAAEMINNETAPPPQTAYPAPPAATTRERHGIHRNKDEHRNTPTRTA